MESIDPTARTSRFTQPGTEAALQGGLRAFSAVVASSGQLDDPHESNFTRWYASSVRGHNPSPAHLENHFVRHAVPDHNVRLLAVHRFTLHDLVRPFLRLVQVAHPPAISFTYTVVPNTSSPHFGHSGAIE
jgi:hypothetical protein